MYLTGRWRAKAGLGVSDQVKGIMKTRMKWEYNFYNWIKQRFDQMHTNYVQHAV